MDVQIKIAKGTACEFEQYSSLYYYLIFITALILLSELSDCSNINTFLCLFDCVIVKKNVFYTPTRPSERCVPVFGF